MSNEIPQWEGFVKGRWSEEAIDVREFIQLNYTPYEGDDSFLAEPTDATKKLWDQTLTFMQREREAGGVLDMDTDVVSSITSHGAGYINKNLEKIIYRHQQAIISVFACSNKNNFLISA